MSFKKFLQNMIDIFNLEPDLEDGRKKSLKELIDKLKAKKKELKKQENTDMDKKAIKEMEEEIEILKLHIKKGKKILKKLSK